MPNGAAPAVAHQAAPARAPAPPQAGREETRQTDQFESTRSLQRAIGNHATGRVVRALGPGHAAFSRGGGMPLPPSVRSEMEARFGTDFSAVRIHAGQAAEHLARAHEAVAYTSGVDITLGPGSDGPETAAGKRLLAHELAHVVQTSKAGAADFQDSIGKAGGIDERDADAAAAAVAAGRAVPALRPAHASILRQTAPTAAVSGIGLSVSLSGLDFDVPDEVTYKPGRRTPQLLTIVLRRLVGDGFKEELLTAVEKALDKVPATRRIGGFRDRTPAKGGERVGHISFGLRQSVVLVGLLKGRKLEVALTPSQEDLLVLGLATVFLWGDFVEATRGDLPRWYTKEIFDREMSQQGALLREYANTLQRAAQGDEEAARDNGVIRELVPALMQPIGALDEIRKDIALAGDEKTASPYAALWQLPKAPKGQQPKLTAPPTRLRSSNVAILMLGYMRTQKQLAIQADAYHDARRQLMIQFAAYTERIFYEGSPGKQGDEEIRDRPATANARAFPSTLAPMSGTAGPLYEAALGTDHRFHMEVQFPSVYEALGRYGFTWERVRIPDEQIGQPVDPDKLKGERITGGEVASVRFSRATAYNKADINRVADSMEKTLGPAGIGALELATAGAILRYVGTGIRVALELLTMPADQQLVVFPTPGLYMVRARMAQVLEGGEEVVRVPSVAYYPVLARNPDEMAKAGVQAILKSKEARKKRVEEIQKQLAEGKLEPDERKRLEQELADLRARDASLSERLEAQRKTAQDQLDRIKAGGEGSEEDAEDALKAIDKRIALRKKRGVGEDAESLTARFVSDLGQVVPLVMEVVDKTPPNAKANFHRVYVSDVTTPKSGDDTGTGKTRDDAIVDAVKTILEGIEGYGRGRVSIALSGGVRTIRIEASVGSILSESVENVTTALSLAAVVAAPFTAGTSLGFLVPLGMVGAIPSAYRVYTHVESGTFSLDIQEATDIANIAGSVIGLGRMGASSLKWVRVGRGLMIVGFGLDAAGGLLMGASLMEQINALEKLPPGERSAQLLMLIGQQLIQGGILVGGSLAEHGSQLAAERGPAKVKGLGGGGEPIGGAPHLEAQSGAGRPELTAPRVTPEPGVRASERLPATREGETSTSPLAEATVPREAETAPRAPGIEGKSTRSETAAKSEAAAGPEQPTEKPSKPQADVEATPGKAARPDPAQPIGPEHVDELIGRIERGGETGGFQAEGSGVRVPVKKPPKKRAWEAHEPARVLEAGAGKGTGPEGATDRGIPPQRKLAPVTKTDIRARKPADAPRASRGRYHLDATQPVPPGLVGQFDTVLINNPRGFTPNIAELGKALAPGGRIIVQGRGRVGTDSPKNRRGFNPDFQRLLDEPAPPGYRKTTDVAEGGLPPAKGNTSKDIVGGPFYTTEGDRRIHPNSRVIFEKLPTEGPTGPRGAPEIGAIPPTAPGAGTGPSASSLESSPSVAPPRPADTAASPKGAGPTPGALKPSPPETPITGVAAPPTAAKGTPPARTEPPSPTSLTAPTAPTSPTAPLAPTAPTVAGSSTPPRQPSKPARPSRNKGTYTMGHEDVSKGRKPAPNPEVEVRPPPRTPRETGMELSDADRAMMAESEQAAARLGKPLKVKTKAATADESSPVRRSGSGKRGSGPDLTKRVMEIGKAMDHPFEENGSLDNGVPGQAAASHAEKIAAISNPDRPLAVDRPMCPDCEAFFARLAWDRKTTLVVEEPGGRRQIFRHDGSRVVVTPDAIMVYRPDGSVGAEPRVRPATP